MRLALERFEENINRAKEISGLGESLSKQITSLIDITDLYRAAIVLGVSAFDFFIHEVVRLGMLEVHRGSRVCTPAYLAFKIPISATQIALSDNTKDEWLEYAVLETHSWQTFQAPDKIADAIRLISEVKLWNCVGVELNEDPKQVKANLIAIVERRNKIAHEADIDPVNPGFRWPITCQLSVDALDYLEKIVRAIYKLL